MVKSFIYLQIVIGLVLTSILATNLVYADTLETDSVKDPDYVMIPLVRTVDLDVGDITEVELHDGSVAEVELLNVDPMKDSVMGAVREVRVTIAVNGETMTNNSGNYHLPVLIGGVQVDCPVTLDYMELSNTDWWGLEKDVRLRLWPGGSPYVWPGTFVYPVKQKWLASSKTQFSNEPVRGSPRADGQIYYHAGIDFGGAEDMVEIVAATDGVVVSVRGDVLESEPEGNPIRERYDVVYLRDVRGWYYRYSHFDSIESNLEVGDRVRAGQKLGMLGKEGGSGGWTHLHFHIESVQPSGKWGVQEAYAFLMEAYQRQYEPEILAIARPYKTVLIGEPAIISGANSWAKGEITDYEWTLSDGSVASGVEVERVYENPGTYSELLKVTDAQGNYDYDAATVMVFSEANLEARPHRIHAAYYPTQEIKPGDKVYFHVRSRGTSEGFDVWDFDDGSELVSVKSDIETGNHSKVGYAMVTHRFEDPGDYLVKVKRETSEGTATAHLYVKVSTP